MKLKTGEILNKDQDKKVVSTVKLSKGTRAGTIKLVVNGEEQDNVAIKNFKGGYGSGIGSGDITELWEAINKKLDVDFFHNIFTVFTNENSEIQPNTYEGTADNLKISIGTWSEKFLSALGKNPDEGQGTGMGTVIGIALGDADPIFPDENSGIVTLPAYPSKVSQLENDSNFITQSVMTNYVTTTLNTALSNYYTKAEADAKFMTIAAFERIFNIYDENSQKLSHPYASMSPTSSIKAIVGLWTEQYLSALGLNSSGGSGGGSVNWIRIGEQDYSPDQAGVTDITDAFTSYSYISNGVVHIGDNTYTYSLPTASSSILGGVIVGNTLTITNSGVLNLFPVGTAGTYVGVTVDSYGRVISGTSASNYYTKAQIDDAFLSKAFFQKLFQAYNLNSTNNVNSPVNPVNPTTDASAIVNNLESIFGFWTREYISALGRNSDSGGGGIGTVTAIKTGNNSYLEPDVETGIIDMSSYFTKWNNIANNGVTNVGYSGKKLSQTINGNTTDIVSASTLFTDGLPTNVTKSYVLAAPANNAGTPQFRQLTLADIPNTTDLQTIAGLSGTTGFLKKTGSGQWALDTDVAVGTRKINAGNGLTGGGDLTADRTLSVLLQQNSGLIVSASGLKLDIINNLTTESTYKAISATQAKYIWDYLTSMFEREGTGTTANPYRIKAKYGFYSVSYVSALGSNSDSGSGGLDEEAMWAALTTNTGTYKNTKINVGHIPDIASTYNYVKTSDLSAYATKDWVSSNFNKYTLPLASSSTRGGVKIGFTTSGKNYAVQLSNEKMYVNVPWTDTTYTIAGLMGTTSVGNATTPVYWSGSTWKTCTSYSNASVNYAASATKATQDGDGNTISSTYLPLSGGTMTGKLKWNNSSALSAATSTSYVLCIDNFNSGGETHYITTNNLSVGSATKATQDGAGNTITTGYVRIITTSSSYLDNSTGSAVIGFNQSGNPIDGTTTQKYGAVIQWSNTNAVAPATSAQNNWYFQLIGTTTTDLYWRKRYNGGNWSTAKLLLDSGNGVTLGTTQTITGLKTFNNTVKLQGAGIEDVGGAGLLAYHLAWVGTDTSRWTVGAIDSQGVIRSGNQDLEHYRYTGDTSTSYRWSIIDTYNLLSNLVYDTSFGNNAPCAKLVTIKITSTYRNEGINFSIVGRGSSTPCHVSIKFSNSSSSDPSLSTFCYEGNPTYGALLHLYKTATSTWEVWTSNQQTYDRTYVYNVTARQGITITPHRNAYESALPSSPLASYSCSPTVAYSTYINFRNTADSNNAGYCGRGSTANNDIALMAYSGNKLLLGASGTTMMTLDGTNVGIGTTSPSQKLHVNGGNILCSGEITALSDIRQKSQISNVNTRIEDAADLPIFYFKWKAGHDDNMHIGTSAQAVQKLFPELVLGGEELSVNYGVLGTTLGILNSRKLIKHEDDIKELKKETKALRKENKALKERIKVLEGRA